MITSKAGKNGFRHSQRSNFGLWLNIFDVEEVM